MSEFRIVLQIEQLDVNGEVLCTYGPADPLILLNTDDAEQVISTFEDMRGTLRDEFSEIVDAYDGPCMDCRMPIDRCIC